MGPEIVRDAHGTLGKVQALWELTRPEARVLPAAGPQDSWQEWEGGKTQWS